MSRALSTGLGLVALVLWSTSNALTRALVEGLGPYTLLAAGFGTGGLVLAAWECARQRSLTAPFRLPWRYGVTCGPSFVGYCGAYALANHLAPDDRTALVLGLVNYLWPMTLLLFSLVFQGNRARWILLAPGLGLALLGIGVASGSTPQAAFQALRGSPGAFALMLAAAVLWGLYSNLSARYGVQGLGGIALFQVVAGGLFLGLSRITGEVSRWTWDLWLPLGFLALGVCAAGYGLWDQGVKRGDLVLLGAASNAVPVASLLFGCWYLEQPFTGGLLLGGAGVAIGAVLCRRGILAPAR